MTQLEANLKALKEGTVEMITLSKIQLQKSKQAFLEKDQDLAEEIFISEENLNNFELSIDFREPFVPRRGRINCSLNDNGKWRWFGTQFTIRPD